MLAERPYIKRLPTEKTNITELYGSEEVCELFKISRSLSLCHRKAGGGISLRPTMKRAKLLEQKASTPTLLSIALTEYH